MDNKTIFTAKKYNIFEKIEKLEKELLSIEDVVKVEFDLDGFYDNIRQVIFIAKYDIPVNATDYFARKTYLRNEVKKVANDNGLRPSGDTIEDYGESYYFVFDCDKSWNEPKYLLLRKEMFSKLLSSEKSSTSRFGKRDFNKGDILIFKMTEDETVACNCIVTDVMYCKFEDLTEEEARMEGYSSLKEMKDSLIKIYSLTSKDEITLIHFRKES